MTLLFLLCCNAYSPTVLQFILFWGAHFIFGIGLALASTTRVGLGLGAPTFLPNSDQLLPLPSILSIRLSKDDFLGPNPFQLQISFCAGRPIGISRGRQFGTRQITVRWLSYSIGGVSSASASNTGCVFVDSQEKNLGQSFQARMSSI